MTILDQLASHARERVAKAKTQIPLRCLSAHNRHEQSL